MSQVGRWWMDEDDRRQEHLDREACSECNCGGDEDECRGTITGKPRKRFIYDTDHKVYCEGFYPQNEEE